MAHPVTPFSGNKELSRGTGWLGRNDPPPPEVRISLCSFALPAAEQVSIAVLPIFTGFSAGDPGGAVQTSAGTSSAGAYRGSPPKISRVKGRMR